MMIIRSVRDPVAIHATWIGGHTEKTLTLPPSATLTGIAPPPAISPCQSMVSLGAVGGGVRKARGRDWEGTEVVMIGAAGSHRLMHLWMEVSPLGQIEATFAPLPLPCPVPLGPWSSVTHMSGRVPMRELMGTGGGDGGESDVMVDSLCEEIPRVVGVAGRYPSSAIQIIALGRQTDGAERGIRVRSVHMCVCRCVRQATLQLMARQSWSWRRGRVASLPSHCLTVAPPPRTRAPSEHGEHGTQTGIDVIQPCVPSCLSVPTQSSIHPSGPVFRRRDEIPTRKPHSLPYDMHTYPHTVIVSCCLR